MLTLTPCEHLARIRSRLSEHLSDEEYNDCAVIAMYYVLHAKQHEDREEAALLYDLAVRERAAKYPITQG